MFDDPYPFHVVAQEPSTSLTEINGQQFRTRAPIAALKRLIGGIPSAAFIMSQVGSVCTLTIVKPCRPRARLLFVYVALS